MKEFTIISGKGGTGKTSITAALASAGSDLVMCDCDVDAADLHLITDPHIKETHVFEGAWTAEINPDKCDDCGICSLNCHFDAIGLNGAYHHQIDPYLCEGCRLCERLCPTHAITSTRSTGNSWFISETRNGPMVHAHMGPGEDNSGKLVTLVRKKAREIALDMGLKYILTDGPPGTGCATIASVSGADAVLVIIEPSLTSLHDAGRAIELVQEFKIPLFALINKASINPEVLVNIRQFLIEKEIPLLAEIPFDKSIVEAMIKGKSIVEYQPKSEVTNLIRSGWQKLCNKEE